MQEEEDDMEEDDGDEWGSHRSHRRYETHSGDDSDHSHSSSSHKRDHSETKHDRRCPRLLLDDALIMVKLFSFHFIPFHSISSIAGKSREANSYS